MLGAHNVVITKDGHWFLLQVPYIVHVHYVMFSKYLHSLIIHISE